MQRNLMIKGDRDRGHCARLHLRHHRIPEVPRRRRHSAVTRAAGIECAAEHPSRARPEGRQPPGAAGAGAGRRQDRGRSDRSRACAMQRAPPASSIEGFDRNDPQTLQETDSIQVNIHGVDQTKTQAFRSLIADKFPDWILTPVNATDYKMNMKPSALIDLKRNTVAQERDTIERRVNALGLTEPTVQDYGAPDNAVGNSGGTAGRRRSGAREGTDRLGGAAQDRRSEERRPVEDQGRSAGREGRHSAARTPNCSTGPAGVGNGSGGWYLVIAHRRDHGAGYAQRHGRAPIPIARAAGNAASLSRRTARGKFGAFTGAQYRQPAGGGAGQPDHQRGHDSEHDRRFGRHQRAGHRSRKPPIWR